MAYRYLPVGKSKIRSFILIGYVLFLYLLDNLPISSLIDYFLYSNIIKPVLWTGMSIMVLLFPRVRSKSPLKLCNSLNWWAFIFALINISTLFLAGFLDGFGKSPYDHSLKGYLFNLVTVGAMLVGREAARGYIVNSLARGERFSVFISMALFMTLSNFTIERFTGLKGYEGAVEFFAHFVAPEFSQNLLASYLAFLGGWIPSLIYMCVLQVFNWFSPILPDLKWITAALIGVMCPVFSIIAMQSIYSKETRDLKKHEKDKESPVGWMVTSMVSIGIIWFAVGVFPIYPSVIATGSMEPVIKPGDVILVEKIREMEDIDQLKKGDI